MLSEIEYKGKWNNPITIKRNKRYILIKVNVTRKLLR